MKTLAFAALAALVILSCTSPAELGRNLENEALQIKYVDAQINGRTDEMAGYLADNYKSRGPGVNDSTDKAGVISSWRKDMDSVYSSVTYDRYAILSTHVDEGRVAGDWVMDWGIVTINFREGKTPVKFWFHSVSRVKDGKIEFSHGFYDTFDVLSQRGFGLRPPAQEMP